MTLIGAFRSDLGLSNGSGRDGNGTRPDNVDDGEKFDDLGERSQASVTGLGSGISWDADDSQPGSTGSGRQLETSAGALTDASGVPAVSEPSDLPPGQRWSPRRKRKASPTAG
jgi:hypothetical protein